ncbi:hypothetical protein J5X84_17050 [Streptosporangiaceae bacterium NEAU-GS5]|nr:hypothetical protein [Streptosporangiaceae bacterium NEAU-GS5]
MARRYRRRRSGLAKLKLGDPTLNHFHALAGEARAADQLINALKGTTDAWVHVGAVLVIKEHGEALAYLLPFEAQYALSKDPEIPHDADARRLFVERLEPVPSLAACDEEIRRREELLSQIHAELGNTVRRLSSWAARAAVEPERDEEWRAALSEIAATGTRKEVVLFAVGVLYAGLHSRATWMTRVTARPGISGMCWVLRSHARTRTLIGGLLLWAGMETVSDTGIGAAILLVITGAGGLELVAKALRSRFHIQPRAKAEERE